MLSGAQAASNSKLFRQAVRLLQPLAAADDVDGLTLLAEVLCAAGRPQEAAEQLLPVAKRTPGDARVLRQLGDCFLQAQQWELALETYKAALAAVSEQQPLQQQEPQHLQPQEHEQQIQEQEHQQQQVDLHACCAAAMYRMGGAHAEAARALAQSVLQHYHHHQQQQQLHHQHQQQQQHQEQQQQQQHLHDGHVVALRLCAQMAADQQQWGPCAQAAAQLLSKVPHDRQGARLLAQAVQDPAGMQALLSALLPTTSSNSSLQVQATASPAARSAQAVAYLAHTLLAEGAVQQAVQLHRTAVQLNPRCSSCALGLAQTLEVQCDYAGVLQALLGFCRSNLGLLQVGPLSLQAVLHLHGLQQLSQQPVQLDSFDWLQHQPVSNDSCSPCNNGDDQPQQSPPLQLQTAQRQGMHSQLQHQLQEVHEQHQQDSGSSAVGVDPKALALLLTAARVLFCAGALQTALQLLQLCAPAEQAAAAHQPLHLSSIRNEAAYAALIRKLLSVEALPAAAVCEGGRGRQQVLYVCGDSHTLSLAWRVLDQHGEQHLMVPLLVPGCKAWHLREGSTHPCTQHFKAAVAAVPRGAKLLLLLGEIDCRDGLVLAVEKMKYDTLEEAAAATARVYVNAVQQLVQQHQLHVWLHSVPPVLSETRVVVQLFNSAVERECAQHAATSSAAAGGGLGRLQFVDLDDALQQDARCLQFDGTHLHPCYVEHLQAALQCNPSM